MADRWVHRLSGEIFEIISRNGKLGEIEAAIQKFYDTGFRVEMSCGCNRTPELEIPLSIPLPTEKHWELFRYAVENCFPLTHEYAIRVACHYARQLEKKTEIKETD